MSVASIMGLFLFVTDMFYRIQQAAQQGRHCLMILPNPNHGYIKLAHLLNTMRVDCRPLHVFIMDEYADENGNIAPESFPQGFMRSFLYGAPETNCLRLQEAMRETDGLRETPNLLGFRPEIMYVAKTGAGSSRSLSAIQPQTTQALYEAAQGRTPIWGVTPELDARLGKSARSLRRSGLRGTDRRHPGPRHAARKRRLAFRLLPDAPAKPAERGPLVRPVAPRCLRPVLPQPSTSAGLEERAAGRRHGRGPHPSGRAAGAGGHLSGRQDRLPAPLKSYPEPSANPGSFAPSARYTRRSWAR
jgi:hypothetical protein